VGLTDTTDTEAKEILVQAKQFYVEVEDWTKKTHRAENVRVGSSLNRRRGRSPGIGQAQYDTPTSVSGNFRIADCPLLDPQVFQVSVASSDLGA
jgi:hypothetical protein